MKDDLFPKNSKTFCAAPWVHFLTVPDGSILPCCMAKEAVRKETGDGFNIRVDKPADIWNGTAYKRIRQALLDGEHLPHCSLCYDKEKIGLSSYRHLFNSKYVGMTDPTGEDLLSSRLVDPSDPLTVKRPIFFDIRLGNICNLKCRMCGPNLSSQIEKDGVATTWLGYEPGQRIGDLGDWPEAADLLADLKEFCVEAVRLELVGGEPTLSKGQMEILQYLAENDLAGSIDLLLITNMTNTNDAVYRTISKFGNVTAHFSVEAVGPVNDYIRFPAKWSQISKNVLDIKARYKNIYFGASPTFQAYNILDVCDLFDWCIQNGVEFGTGNILTYPSWLSVLVLPYSVRRVAAERLERWVINKPVTDIVKNDILRVATYLRDESLVAPQEDIEKFVLYTNDLDRTRKQDIRKSLPELYALWTEERDWDHQIFRHSGKAGKRDSVHVSAASAEGAPDNPPEDGKRPWLTLWGSLFRRWLYRYSGREPVGSVGNRRSSPQTSSPP